MSIVALLSSLASSAITAVQGSANFNDGVTRISSMLDGARAYAIAKNTYVYVGFSEVDGTVPVQANPQQKGSGRVAVVTMASKDGTRGFDINSADPDTSWSQNYNSGSDLMLVAKPVYIGNVDFADPRLSSLAMTGNMQRPALVSSNDHIGGTLTSATPLAFPLGQPLTGGQYTFTYVIYFDPQGAAHFQSAAGSALAPYLEIDFQPLHGNVLPASTPSNLAAIQVDGISGAVRVYRP